MTSSLPAPAATIAIVNWNGAHLLSACLDPLLETAYEIIVVDNGSTDGSKDLLAQKSERVSTIFNAENRGFAAANNQAIKLARGRHVVLLNNDTVPSAVVIEEMCAFLDQNPSVAIVGPALVDLDGSPQPSCGPGPSLWTELLAKTVLHRLLPIRELAPSRSRRVDWVTGAALAVRADVAHQLGGLDEGMFMYYEDLDLCARARARGHEVWFLATSDSIVHLGGATSRTVRATSLVRSYESTDRYFARHGPRWRRRAIRGLTLLEAVLRSILWTALSVNPGRRREARDRLGAYAVIFRRALKDPL